MSTDDLHMVLAWRNHPDVRRFMFTQHEISLAEHRSWFAKASQDESRRLLIVEDLNNPIAYVQFSDVISDGVSDWGFYVRPDAPKGTGSKMGVTALNYAFGVLKLHKVCGQAINSNHASITFHGRLGFLQEGILREQKRINGLYHDLHCFGLLSHEWQPQKLFQEKKHVEN